jgi:hypothetical protein
MADHVSESGHWYDPISGEPRYTYTNKKGETKNTTLRQARASGLVPSVTMIIACANKPQLTNWMIDQNILSCLTLSRNENETEQEYLARIKADAKEQAKKAAERGTLIHSWVQEWFEGKLIAQGSDEYPFCNSANETIFNEVGFQEFICEKSFATERYGGKADIHNERYLIDIKTKTWTDKEKLDIWESHLMQLAAYRHGLNIPEARCGILYVHQDTAESVLLWADEDKLKQGLEMFTGLLDFYYAKTKLGR